MTIADKIKKIQKSIPGQGLNRRHLAEIKALFEQNEKQISS
jgi:hypothetical protein